MRFIQSARFKPRIAHDRRIVENAASDRQRSAKFSLIYSARFNVLRLESLLRHRRISSLRSRAIDPHNSRKIDKELRIYPKIFNFLRIKNTFPYEFSILYLVPR